MKQIVLKDVFTAIIGDFRDNGGVPTFISLH